MLPDPEKLHFIQLLFPVGAAVFGDEKPGQVIRNGGVGGNAQQGTPAVGDVAGLLPQLPAGGLQGGGLRGNPVLPLDGAGREFRGHLPDALAELADAEEPARLIRSNDDHVIPAGIAVIGLEDPSVRKTEGALSEIDPFVLNDMLRGDLFPDEILFIRLMLFHASLRNRQCFPCYCTGVSRKAQEKTGKAARFS